MILYKIVFLCLKDIKVKEGVIYMFSDFEKLQIMKSEVEKMINRMKNILDTANKMFFSVFVVFVLGFEKFLKYFEIFYNTLYSKQQELSLENNTFFEKLVSELLTRTVDYQKNLYVRQSSFIAVSYVLILISIVFLFFWIHKINPEKVVLKNLLNKEYKNFNDFCPVVCMQREQESFQLIKNNFKKFDRIYAFYMFMMLIFYILIIVMVLPLNTKISITIFIFSVFVAFIFFVLDVVIEYIKQLYTFVQKIWQAKVK